VPEEAWEILSGMVAVARRAEDEQASSRVPTWLKELRSYVSTRPEEVRRVSMLATRAGVSREHLTRAYRQHYGAPISDFLRNARLIQAYDRVVESRVPLSDISSSCGFADQSHMTRLFVKQFGVSPAALRSPSANITTVQEIQPTR
jgi:transcriptional regulator GlxA family with amidase domain